MLVPLMVGLAVAATPAPDPAFAAMDSSFLVMTADSTGAGFLVDGDLVVTAAHVVGSANSVELQSGTTMPRKFGGTVVFSDEVSDIALIRPNGAGTVPALSLQAQEPTQGEVVYTIGGPIDGLVASRGVVVDTSGPAIEATTPVDHGNSGGPLVDSQGDVVGMVVQMDAISGHSFSVPAGEIESAIALLDDGATPAPTAADDVPLSASQTGWIPFVVVLTLVVAIVALGLSLVALSRARERKRNHIYVTLD